MVNIDDFRKLELKAAKIKQVITRNYCLDCNGCCRFSEQDSVWLPRLLAEETQELLKRHIPPSLISCDKKIRSMPYPKQNNFTPPLPRPCTQERGVHARVGFICFFFQPEDNKCNIYAFRPFECQLYPFLINRKADKVFLALDLKCPFVKENLESQKFKAYIRYLTNFFNNPCKIKVLKNNPQIIQIYENVLNLAELHL